MNLLKSVDAKSRTNIPVGVATMNDERISLYVIDPEQNLLQLLLSDENNWTGVGLGAPPGVGLISGIGATADPAGTSNGYAFALGDDGNIWANYDGNWASLGPMPNGIIAKAYAGASLGESTVNVFVFGSDGNLYCCTSYGSIPNRWNWSGIPSPFGQPVFGTIGVTGMPDVVNGGPYCLALGQGGNIYCGPNPEWNSLDAPPGVQITEPIGATMAAAMTGASPTGGIYPFATAAIIDSTNNVWTFQFDPSSQQAPFRTPLLSGQGSTPVIGVGAASFEGTGCAIYVLSEDNTLWMYLWTWNPLGTPSAKLVRPVGVAVNMKVACAFIADENGGIWCNTWDQNSGSWACVA
ncbi:hypothetical protein IV454_29320 [Massilia antarctica]|uniref:WD40 repeat domain-containing protein n=1 Tax=Massilia antarctica TaxID=2765360 RepID=A0AA49A7L7_9BURK|nr:hypothetical protein [Massilia antarctica]QPI49489.1 hypothetical protein IV454_29320 [Massilia antarctica]